jgi:hypothetical protein
MLCPVNHQIGVGRMTNPTVEPLSERLNVQVTPSMKARVAALTVKQGLRAESEIVRKALAAYLKKEESR